MAKISKFTPKAMRDFQNNIDSFISEVIETGRDYNDHVIESPLISQFFQTLEDNKSEENHLFDISGANFADDLSLTDGDQAIKVSFTSPLLTILSSYTGPGGIKTRPELEEIIQVYFTLRSSAEQKDNSVSQLSTRRKDVLNQNNTDIYPQIVFLCDAYLNDKHNPAPLEWLARFLGKLRTTLLTIEYPESKVDNDDVFVIKYSDQKVDMYINFYPGRIAEVNELGRAFLKLGQ